MVSLVIVYVLIMIVMAFIATRFLGFDIAEEKDWGWIIVVSLFWPATSILLVIYLPALLGDKRRLKNKKEEK